MDWLCGLVGIALFFGPLVLLLVMIARKNERRHDVNAMRQDLRQLQFEVAQLQLLVRPPQSSDDSVASSTPLDATSAAKIGDLGLPHGASTPSPDGRSSPSPQATDSTDASTDLTIQRRQSSNADRSARATLEETIGSMWLAWLGGLVALVAVGLALKYASEQGWITAQIRSVSAAIIGIALVPFGMRLASTRYGNLGQALSATGLVVLIVDLVVAHVVHGFIPSPLVAIALILVPIGAIWWLTGRWKSPGMHALGLLAGLMAPVIIGIRPDNAGWMLSFGVLVSLSALALAVKHDFRFSLACTSALCAVFCALVVPMATSTGLVFEAHTVVASLLVLMVWIARPGAAAASRHINGIDLRATGAVMALMVFPIGFIGQPIHGHVAEKALLALLPGFILASWLVLPYCPTAVRFIVGTVLSLALEFHLSYRQGFPNSTASTLPALMILLVGTFVAFVLDGRKRAATNDVAEPFLVSNFGSVFMGLPFAFVLVHLQNFREAALLILPISAVVMALACRSFRASILLPAFAVFQVIAFYKYFAPNSMPEIATLTAFISAATSASALAVAVRVVPQGILIPRMAWLTSSLMYFALSPIMIGSLLASAPGLPSWLIPILVDAPGFLLLFMVGGGAPRATDNDRVLRGALTACGVVALLLLADGTVSLVFQPDRIVPYIGLFQPILESKFATLLDASLAEQACRSLVWATFGITLVLIGFLRQSAPLRRGGLLLLGLTFAKCAWIDVWQLSGLWRIGALAALSLALFFAAYLYQRFLRPMVAPPEPVKTTA